jgi:hypothetical protein
VYRKKAVGEKWKETNLVTARQRNRAQQHNKNVLLVISLILE